MAQKPNFASVLPYIFIIGAVIGLIASFQLTYDKIHVLQDPNYSPGCNINPILSCGSVMKTKQATLLGVPNSIFGLISFTMLLTVGFVILSGAKLKRWLWVVGEVIALAGVIFMHYLFFQGVYRINAICPWCFTVWMATIPIFWYVTMYNLSQRNIRLPKQLTAAGEFIQRHHVDILVVWYLIIFGILGAHFWYYWQTLI